METDFFVVVVALALPLEEEGQLILGGALPQLCGDVQASHRRRTGPWMSDGGHLQAAYLPLPHTHTHTFSTLYSLCLPPQHACTFCACRLGIPGGDRRRQDVRALLH